MVHHEARMASGWTHHRLLGRGAMGAVHLVADEDGKMLAIKRPREEVAEPMVATYRHLQTLEHPNVVGVLDVGADDDGPYIALEHIDGVSLGDLIRDVTKVDEEVPGSVALRILEGAARGLAALHDFDTPGGAGGWLHRDVSPSNVLIGRVGTVSVADLDTASPRAAIPGHGGVPTRGKPSYASPEQLADEPLTDKSDVFALAATVGEALARGPLFRDDCRDPEAFIEVADRLADRDDIEPRLVELLFEMLAPLPAHRPTARDVVERASSIASEGAGPSLAGYASSFSEGEREGFAVPKLSVSMPADAAWHVKGAAIAATIDYLIQNFGERAYGRVADHVSDRTVEALRDSIDSAAWYDGRVIVELTEAAQHLYGRGPHSIARDIGVWSAERALSAGGPYQIFRDKGLRKGVLAFVEATEELYGLYYDQGEWSVEVLGEGEARCRLVGVDYPQAVVERIASYLGRGLELIGAEAVKCDAVWEGSGLSIGVSWVER